MAIASCSAQCLRSFQRLSEEAQRLDSESPLSASAVGDELGRFKVWAGNIGALQRNSTSLDYRLREASQIVHQVIKILQHLELSLLECIEIVSGHRAQKQGRSSDGEAFSDEFSDISDSESSEGPDVSAGEPEPVTEIFQLFSAVTEAITSLYKLSIAIRRPTPRDRYAKAASSIPFDASYDVDHVYEKFPHVRSKAWLIDKLGSAITRRREFLRYRENHREKIGGSNRRPTDFSIPHKLVDTRKIVTNETEFQTPGFETQSTSHTQLVSTKATTYVANLDDEILDTRSTADRSETSYVTSVAEDDSDNMRQIPEPPKESANGMPFECPYCFTIQSVKNSKHWRRHFLSDLKPYICTFEDCSAQMFETRQTWFQHELDKHRKEWRCNFCSCELFASIASLESHIQGEHSEYSKQQTSSLISLCERMPEAIAASACPFCDWDARLREQTAPTNIYAEATPLKPNTLAVTLSQFQRHVGNHLEQLALFAIPPPMRGSSGASSDKAAASHISKHSLQPSSLSEASSMSSARTNQGKPPVLYVASMSGDIERVTKEAQDGADLTLFHGKYDNVLQAAAAELSSPTRDWMVRTWLDYGADPNMLDSIHGNTLHAVAANPSMSVLDDQTKLRVNMDPISISASIIALMQLSSTIIGYLSNFKGSHEEHQKIRLGLCNTLPMLSILQDQAEQAQDGDEWSSTLLSLSAADGPIQQFREALEWLEHKLVLVRGVKKVGKAFISPFEKAEIQSILNTIERQKLLFSLARQNDHISLSRAIKGDIEAVHTKIDVISEGLAGLECSEKHDKIRKWLAGPDPSSNYNNALTKRHGGTGGWLIRTDVFLSWKQDSGSGSIIWLYGIPGCGKTILCSTIVEHLLQAYSLTPNTAVLYFFFDFNDPDKQRHENMMRSLLSQLSLHCVNIPPVLEELYSSCLNGKRRATFEAVLKTFHQVSTAFEDTFIVLDALDECNHRSELLASIEEMIRWDDTNLRVLATSRRENDIEDSILPLTKDEARVCIQSALVNADICAYVHEQLQTNRKLQRWQGKPEVQMEIENTLVKKANGMFLWVACQLDGLESCLTLPKLRKTLATLPRTLNDTYARILCSIDEEYQQHTLHILQWLAFSARPLQLEELAEVLAIDFNEAPKLDPYRRLSDPHDVLEICSSLVTVTSSRASENFDLYGNSPVSIAHLAHDSVREYLTSELIVQGQAAKFSLQEIDCHVALAKECLAYLLHFDVAGTLTDRVFAEYPLIRYAAKHWTEHARVAEQRDNTICEEFFLTKGQAFYNWIRVYDEEDHSGDIRPNLTLSPEKIASPLYYASATGLLESVKMLIDKGADVNALGGRQRDKTALFAASDIGHTEIVRLLLEKGADMNTCSVHGAPLHIASSKGNTGIVNLLMDNGADLNMPGAHGTALHMASSKGHTEIVRLLLEHGADVNISEPFGTALLEASSKGHTEIVRLLLEHDADVNIYSTRTALQDASISGHTEIVRLLLEYGADMDVVELLGTALQLAASAGHMEIVDMLLEHGADVTISGSHGTALQLAISTGRKKIAEMLREKGAQRLPRDAEAESRIG